MQLNVRPFVRITIACVLAGVCIVPTNLMAQSHVVSPADLQKELVSASQIRQHDINTVRQFLSTPTAEKALRSAQIDPHQVQTAVSTLDDQELSQIAARATKAQADFAAGAMGERDLIWIILAVALIILIVVAVR